jgi:hypothetical protein
MTKVQQAAVTICPDIISSRSHGQYIHDGHRVGNTTVGMPARPTAQTAINKPNGSLLQARHP